MRGIRSREEPVAGEICACGSQRQNFHVCCIAKVKQYKTWVYKCSVWKRKKTLVKVLNSTSSGQIEVGCLPEVSFDWFKGKKNPQFV